MSDSVPSNRNSNRVHLVFLAVLMIFMYLCMRTLCFTNTGLNLAFGSLFLLLPFFAIKPALGLPRGAKIVMFTLLLPLVAFLLRWVLLSMVACDIPDAIDHRQRSRELCTLQQGQYSVRLA